MISIFKKKRKEQLKSTGMRKYFQYAIGEIILVVIGILIALSINNWNSARYKSKQIEKVVKQVVSDLKADTARVNSILRYYEPVEKIFLQVLGDSLSMEELKECEECGTLITGMQLFTPTTAGYNLLKNYDNDLESHNDSLIHTTKQFYIQALPSMELLNGLVKDDVADNLNEWKHTYDWYADWISRTNRDGYYEYIVNNQKYKNKVAHFYLLLYRNYLVGLRSYSNQAARLSKSWSEIIEE